MPLAEELQRLNNTEKCKENGWRLSSGGALAHRRPRLVSKEGSTLLDHCELPGKFKYAYKNWFHLIIEWSWRRVLMLFTAGFVVSWFFFATVYYIITNISHADLHCIANVDTFVSAFLFSMESQHTIGYGTRYMTTNCPIAYFCLMTQLVIGVFSQTMLAGIVVAKVLRPKKRKQEMRFSRCAVIGPVDETDRRVTLQVRLADIQERLFLAESHVRMYLARTRINNRGDRELIGVKDMNVGYDSGWDRVLLLWPIIVRHVIDESSPLFGLTRETMLSQDFEIIMTVEGIVEATGMTFQARTSYLPEEIQWGQKFCPMILLNEKIGKYEVHYSLFDQTERADDFVLLSERSPDDQEELATHYASGFT